MAKSSRTRAQRKRADYRKGGRVAYQEGGFGSPGGVGGWEEFNPDVAAADDAQTTQTTQTTQAAAPTFTQADVDAAVTALNSGSRSAADIATQYGVTEDYVNQNLNTINTDTSAAIAAIPADGDYTEAEAQQVQDAIALGAVTAEQAATQFGVTANQVTQEITRRKAVQAGEEVTTADPFADTAMRNMVQIRADAEAASLAADAANIAT
jgi:hypothetical protein